MIHIEDKQDVKIIVGGAVFSLGLAVLGFTMFQNPLLATKEQRRIVKLSSPSESDYKQASIVMAANVGIGFALLITGVVIIPK